MLDRHVGNGQPPLDRERADCTAGVLNDIARAACRTQCAGDVQDHVLGGNPGAKRAFDPDFHRFGLGQQQRLRGQHMLNLAGADPEGECAQPAVASGVAVPADDGRAGQRKALFGADDVDDALFGVSITDQADAEFGRIAFQRGQLLRAFRIGDRNARAVRIAPRGRR